MKYLEKANQWRKKADLCSSGSRIWLQINAKKLLGVIEIFLN
jgi:hypothetical protein